MLALALARYSLSSGPLTHTRYIGSREKQGASIVRKFAKSYSIIALARNPENYEAVIQEINSAGGEAIGISADVSDSKSVNAAFDKIQAQYPSSKVAAAIFNPGGGFVRKPFLELTEQDYSTALGSQAYVYHDIHLIYSIPCWILPAGPW